MATIRAFNERVQALSEDIFMEVFMESNAHVIEKNLDQLQEGKDKNERNLKQYSQQDYAEWKNQLNPKAGLGNPDLKVTGDFWQGFVLTQTGGTKYEIKSTDSKAGKLSAKYGEDIYGLADPKRDEFVSETYRPKLTAKVKEILKL